MDRGGAPIRIVVADDHPLFRDGLRRLLESEPDFAVVGEAADGSEAVRLVRELKPEILLLDLAMPGAHGIDVMRELAGQPEPMRTLVLTAAIEKRQIVEALQLGARGVILKESATEMLFKGIRSVMAGQYWVGRESVSDLVQYLRKLGPVPGSAADDRKFGLSPRELEVVFAVVSGQSNKDIARKFTISEQTVKHHISSIFGKLGVNSRLELALFAMSNGLIENR